MSKKRRKPRISYEWQKDKIVKLENGKEINHDLTKKPEIKDPNPTFAKVHQRYLDKRRKHGKGN